jgi:hypothetical protein
VLSKKPSTSSLSELDLMHQETMSRIRDYNYSDTLPSGQI